MSKKTRPYQSAGFYVKDSIGERVLEVVGGPINEKCQTAEMVADKLCLFDDLVDCLSDCADNIVVGGHLDDLLVRAKKLVKEGRSL